MTVAELDTKPLLKARGLKMHFPVTDLTVREAMPRRNVPLQPPRARPRLSPRRPGCAPNSAGFPVLSTFPGLIRVAEANGSNGAEPQVCPDGTSHHQNRW